MLIVDEFIYFPHVRANVFIIQIMNIMLLIINVLNFSNFHDINNRKHCMQVVTKILKFAKLYYMVGKEKLVPLHSWGYAQVSLLVVPGIKLGSASANVLEFLTSLYAHLINRSLTKNMSANFAFVL